MADFLSRVRGGLANLVAGGGKVYNRFTGEYAPAKTRTARLVSGGLSKLGPGGAVAGLIYSGLNNRGNEAQAWDASLRGWKSIDQQLSQRPEVQSPGVQVGNVPMTMPRLNFQVTPAVVGPATQMPAPQTPWTGSLAGSNPFGGQYGGNLGAAPMQAPRMAGNGAGAGTGYGASSYQNDSWGDVASGFGVGNNAQRDPGLPAVYNERPLPKWMR